MPKEVGFQRREIYYQGTVQGVGFRYTAQRIAAGFQVAGFVRNLSDGRVELVAEGEEGELDRFLAAIRQRMGHLIGNAEETTGPALGESRGFEIRF